MRFASIVVIGAMLSACVGSEADSGVDARDACFAVGKVVDNVTLTTGAMKVDLDRSNGSKAVFHWFKEHHGENYTCDVDLKNRKILRFTKNGIPLLDEAPEKMKAF